MLRVEDMAFSRKENTKTFQNQDFRPESIHVKNIIYTEQIVSRAIYVQIFNHAMTVNENQCHAQRGGQEDIGRFGQREGEGGVMQLHHNLENKRKLKKMYMP